MQPIIQNITPRRPFGNWYAFISLLLLLLPIFTKAQVVIGLTVQDGINPGTTTYIQEGITRAEKIHAACLLIRFNAPGGLLNVTKDIVDEIHSSSVPVVIYIAPEEAEVGSSGLLAALAAHRVAMAPGTSIKTTVARPNKADNLPFDTVDAASLNPQSAALLKIVDLNGNRNMNWVSDALNHPKTLDANSALQLHVIDIVAINEQDLLRQLQGQKVRLMDGSTIILDTQNGRVEDLKMGLSQELMGWISDPTIVYVILILGFMGLLFEVFNPGAIFPGVIGIVCLFLAFYGLLFLPVNYAGIILIVIGIVLYLLEIKIISHGLLAIGGTAAILLGSHILFESRPEENIAPLNWGTIIFVTVIAILFFLFIIVKGLRAQKLKPVSGASALIGETAIAVDALEPKGQVLVLGELWTAIATSGHIQPGQKVIIKEMRDLTLFVEGQTN
ncbi:MAG TPA: NfeD family protein [Arachidicoccus sp.]|nr:NfeD family protein [Arachidicoccus sp.]